MTITEQEIELARQKYEQGTISLEIGNPVHILMKKQIEKEKADELNLKTYEFVLRYSCTRRARITAGSKEEAMDMAHAGDFDEDFGSYEDEDLEDWTFAREVK